MTITITIAIAIAIGVHDDETESREGVREGVCMLESVNDAVAMVRLYDTQTPWLNAGFCYRNTP